MAYINVDDNAESEAQAMAEADAESDPDADNSDKQIQEESEEINFASDELEPERVPFYIEHLPEATLFSKDDASNFQEEEREESSGIL